MIKKILKASFTLAVTALTLGCIQSSPLLNHAEAKSNQTENVNLDNPKGCAFFFQKNKLCASLTWVDMPTQEKKGEFILRFWNSETGTEAGPYINPTQTVFVKLFMPSMGHGSSPVTIQGAKDQAGQPIVGTYRVSDVYFVMPGEWEIWVQLKDGTTIVEKAKIDIEI